VYIRIVGGIVGGLLANPAATYPALFASIWLFTSYPYLLPCLVSAFISSVGLFTGFCFLKETLKKKRAQHRFDQNHNNHTNNNSNDNNSINNNRNHKDDTEEKLFLERNGKKDNEEREENAQSVELTLLTSQHNQQEEEEEEEETKEPIHKNEEKISIITATNEENEREQITPSNASLLYRCCIKFPCFRIRPKALQYVLTSKVLCCLIMFTLLVLNFQMFEQAFALLLYVRSLFLSFPFLLLFILSSK
jgi:hypothetical protein